MLSRWLSLALVWVLSLAVAGVYGQAENDFENDPDTKRVAVSLPSCSLVRAVTNMLLPGF